MKIDEALRFTVIFQAFYTCVVTANICSPGTHHNHCYGSICRDLPTYSCEDLSLMDVPNDIPGSTLSLKLSRNSFTNIDVTKIQSQLQSLVRLEAFQNNIQTWPDLDFTKTTIEYIDISDNNISFISFQKLSTYTALYELRLSSNTISSIEPFQFSNGHFPAMERLLLNGNLLTTVPRLCHERYTNISGGFKLSLYDNPLECNACLQWMLSCGYNLNYDYLGYSKCSSPLNLKGSLIKDITIQELINVRCEVAKTDRNSLIQSTYIYGLYTEHSSESTWSSFEDSKISCAASCARQMCQSFDYNKQDKVCVMYDNNKGDYDEHI